MKTLLGLIGGALLIGCAGWAYRVNYDTQEAVNRVKSLQHQITAERQALSVLRAEWAYLNRPDRLRDLAEMHFPDLQLMPIDATHFGDVAEAPFPPEDLAGISRTLDVLGPLDNGEN